TDGYYFLLAHLKGKFKIGVDKDELTVGDHDALAEIFTEGASSTPSDDASFKLKACKSGEPDLVAEFYGAPTNIEQDKKYHTVFVESNGGTANAGPHHVEVYLSSDGVLDAGDELVGDRNTGALPVGPIRVVNVQIELPCDPDTEGAMFLIAWTDAGEVIVESNEGNNVATDEINVIGCSEDEDAEEAADLEEDDGDEDDEKGKKDNGKGKNDD
ncbi:MAG: CARDB domain-containing protein, partial [Nitrososphaerales archaeon]